MQLDLEPRYVEALLNYLAGQKWAEVQALIPPLAQQVEQAQQAAQAGPGDAQTLRAVPAPHAAA